MEYEIFGEENCAGALNYDVLQISIGFLFKVSSKNHKMQGAKIFDTGVNLLLMRISKIYGNAAVWIFRG